MTCSDYLIREGRGCARRAVVIVEFGSKAWPKCAIHARRYRDPVWISEWAPQAVVRDIEAHP